MGNFDEDLLRARHPCLPNRVVDAPHQDVGPAEHRVLGLQRTLGNYGVAQLLRGEDDEGAAVQELLSGGAQHLDESTRARMETAFGEDFGDVRVHTGGEATASAQRLGAHAYTIGNDMVFSEGRYDPGSESGQRTIAHELTHVVQQRSGPVDGTDTGSGVKVSDPTDRFEQAATANAERVVAGEAAEEGPYRVSAEVQRQELPEEEEEVQGLWVQRQEAEEEMAEEVE